MSPSSRFETSFRERQDRAWRRLACVALVVFIGWCAAFLGWLVALVRWLIALQAFEEALRHAR